MPLTYDTLAKNIKTTRIIKAIIKLLSQPIDTQATEEEEIQELRRYIKKEIAELATQQLPHTEQWRKFFNLEEYIADFLNKQHRVNNKEIIETLRNHQGYIPQFTLNIVTTTIPELESDKVYQQRQELIAGFGNLFISAADFDREQFKLLVVAAKQLLAVNQQGKRCELLAQSVAKLNHIQESNIPSTNESMLGQLLSSDELTRELSNANEELANTTDIYTTYCRLITKIDAFIEKCTFSYVKVIPAKQLKQRPRMVANGISNIMNSHYCTNMPEYRYNLLWEFTQLLDQIDHDVYLISSLISRGSNWHARAIKMTKCVDGIFRCAIPVSMYAVDLYVPFAYKYVVVDPVTGKATYMADDAGIKWECCNPSIDSKI